MNKWKHGLQGRAATRRCGVGRRLQGAEGDFANFLRGRFWGLGTNGDGAPPPERMHLKFQIYPSGSPQTKFGVGCNGFVTATPRLAIIWITYWEHDPLGADEQQLDHGLASGSRGLARIER